MHHRLAAALVLLSLAMAACSGSGGSGSGTTLVPSAPLNSGAKRPSAVRLALPTHRAGARVQSATNGVTDGGFESGAFGAWYDCGNAPASITKVKAHSGSYSAFSGSSTHPEVNGYSGVCQDVTIPANGTLTFWLDEGTNDTIAYADQEADLLDSSGSAVETFFSEATTTNGWVKRTYNVSAYAGQQLTLFFGVYGNGWNNGYIYQYVDDASLLVGGSTPTPSPTATPSAQPTATPTIAPTATPTVQPTSTPSGGGPCNNNQFISDQSTFASGSLSGDQLEDVCGLVTQVLPEKHTTSGNHGYFYVKMPNGYNIEIVSNLDAMAQAPTDTPPSTWPWVAVGQYVYVQGRYYYDNASSQGIDWTEDDTGSWPYVGWVYVCSANSSNCAKYW